MTEIESKSIFNEVIAEDVQREGALEDQSIEVALARVMSANEQANFANPYGDQPRDPKTASEAISKLLIKGHTRHL